MKTIPVEKYIEGVESIYTEQPVYQTGHDGSDGKCDCIGMCRGGLIRGGAKDVSGLSGTNYAARKTIKNLRKLESDKLCVGKVVLKVRDKDDASMPLPDRYRKGNSDYSERWGETNFTHIGTVVNVKPLQIMHMTSPSAKVDTTIGKWAYDGDLPWVDYNENDSTDYDSLLTAVVTAESGRTVKMRQKPSTSCRLYWDVPIGSTVIVDETGETWSKITWNDQVGYMMTKFLQMSAEIPQTEMVSVIIPDLTRAEAQSLLAIYPNGYITVG